MKTSSWDRIQYQAAETDMKLQILIGVLFTTNVATKVFTLTFTDLNKIPMFQTPALVVEKDAVFIPAGWDNDKKIAILYENMHR